VTAYHIYRAWQRFAIDEEVNALVWSWAVALGHKGRTMEHVRR
jgi:hypothetical protein